MRLSEADMQGFTEERPTLGSRPRTAQEDPTQDVYEVFVAELEARRERLRQLLDAVAKEAARCTRKCPELPRTHRCSRRMAGRFL